MGAVELREELLKYIEIGDSKFLKIMYHTAQEYIQQKNEDRLMAESEADIEAGRIYSQDEVDKMIEDWTR